MDEIINILINDISNRHFRELGFREIYESAIEIRSIYCENIHNVFIVD